MPSILWNSGRPFWAALKEEPNRVDSADASFKAVTDTFIKSSLARIVRHELGGNPDKISASFEFLNARSRLPSGQEISGLDILYGVAALEKPDGGEISALSLAGKWAEVAQIARAKYGGPPRKKQGVSFGKAVLSACREKAWNLEDLAEATGIDRKRIGRFAKNRVSPADKEIRALARALKPGDSDYAAYLSFLRVETAFIPPREERPIFQDGSIHWDRIADKPRRDLFEKLSRHPGEGRIQVAKRLNQRFHGKQFGAQRFSQVVEGFIYVEGPDDAARLHAYRKFKPNTLGEFLFYARKRLDEEDEKNRNWSVHEACVRIGIAHRYLQQFELNEGKPTNLQLAKIARAYDVPLEELEKLRDETPYPPQSPKSLSLKKGKTTGSSKPGWKRVSNPGEIPAAIRALNEGLTVYLQAKGISFDEVLSKGLTLTVDTGVQMIEQTIKSTAFAGLKEGIFLSYAFPVLAQGLVDGLRALTKQDPADALIASMDAVYGKRLDWDKRLAVFKEAGWKVLGLRLPETEFFCLAGSHGNAVSPDGRIEGRLAFFHEVPRDRKVPYLLFRRGKDQLTVMDGEGKQHALLAQALQDAGLAEWDKAYAEKVQKQTRIRKGPLGARNAKLLRLEAVRSLQELQELGPGFLIECMRELDPLNQAKALYLVGSNQGTVLSNGQFNGWLKLVLQKPDERACLSCVILIRTEETAIMVRSAGNNHWRLADTLEKGGLASMSEWYRFHHRRPAEGQDSPGAISSSHRRNRNNPRRGLRNRRSLKTGTAPGTGRYRALENNRRIRASSTPSFNAGNRTMQLSAFRFGRALAELERLPVTLCRI